MRPRHPIEVESLQAFDALVAEGATSMRDWQLQDLDLSERGSVLRTLDPQGAIILGGRLAPGDEHSLRDRGALIFPTLPDVPFHAYRARLYTPDELYDGLDRGYEHTPDARIYAWSRGPRHLTGTLASALHDHAVDDALAEHLAGRRVVGVMGGHALPRGTKAYAAAARLGQALAATGLTVATGGGPGAMEAANLGAAAAGLDASELTALIERVSRVPRFHPDITAWARAGFATRADLPASGLSLGIPTWHYGHEPPNPFPDAVAKFFRNSLREDLLVRLSGAGIVFLPGAAGTVQEIFADACENYYADGTVHAGDPAPMVLVGREFWTDQLAAWPLLRALGQDRAMGAKLHLADSIDEVLAALRP